MVPKQFKYIKREGASMAYRKRLEKRIREILEDGLENQLFSTRDIRLKLHDMNFSPVPSEKIVAEIIWKSIPPDELFTGFQNSVVPGYEAWGVFALKKNITRPSRHVVLTPNLPAEDPGISNFPPKVHQPSLLARLERGIVHWRAAYDSILRKRKEIRDRRSSGPNP